MSSAGTRRLSPILTVAVLASLAILAAALAYRFWGSVAPQPKEVIQPLQLENLGETISERAKFQISQQVGAHVLSTTEPVETSGKSIPFGQFTVPEDNHDPKLPESDADVHAGIKTATKATVVKFSNSQLCDAQARCPFALMSVGEDGQPDQVIFQITAKSLALSNHITNGNPDLIVDYGDGSAPSRLTWQVDTQFPMYAPAVESPQ